jgi:polyribonucleotide nucleotidyltransferase
LSVGQKILVEITKIDDRGKLSLSPVLAEGAEGASEASEEDAED